MNDLPLQHEVTCPDCGKPMRLRRTQRFKWASGEGRLFYGCSGFPACKAVHGAHPNGAPLGIPGDAPTKAARVRAHAFFDELRQLRGWVGSNRQRSGSYKWLGRKLGMDEAQIENECHIAMFDIATCERVVQICKDAIERTKANGNNGNPPPIQLQEA